ncbi:hypothetical protein [Sphingomonas sp.]|uniref:hypothetical protein n=1 Tax=Sphingomonas sp. TaxID=28214 RepID=UPI003F717341
MQLKIRRSQRESGVISSKVIFAIDVRAEYSPLERANIQRYKLHNEVIYNSEASKRHIARGDQQAAQGTTGGNLKSIASFVLARMNLNITIASLERGHHVECKSMEELLDAEETLIDACKNVKAYLDTAATFDGREVLIDFNGDQPAIVAQTVTPAPMKVVPAPAPTYESAPALPAPSQDESSEEATAEPEYRPPLQAFGIELPVGVEEKHITFALICAAFVLLLLAVRACAY